MTVTRVGSAVVTGSSITLPSHQAGDLILMYAYRSASAVNLLPPSGWFFGPANASGGAGSLVAWKIAASASEVSGTWTSAQALLAVVYRDSANYLLPGEQHGTSSQSSATPSYATISNTTNFRGPSSFVAAFVGARSTDRDVQSVAPTGMVNVTSLTESGRAIGLHDTNGAVSGWSTETTVTSGTGVYHITMLEIHDIGISKASGIKSARGMHGGMAS